MSQRLPPLVLPLLHEAPDRGPGRRKGNALPTPLVSSDVSCFVMFPMFWIYIL